MAEGGEHRCFVGGLAWATDDRALKAAFAPFGEILSSKIIYDPETGRSRWFGFVTFSSAQSVRDAIQGMNGKVLDGRTLTVSEAHPRHPGRGGSSDSRRGSGSSQSRSPMGEGAFTSPFRGFHEIFGDINAPIDAPQQRALKDAPIQHQLPCNLADLYKGATKKMKISRQISDSCGRRTVVEEILTIDIKPGWKKGTKITFPERGNEAPNLIPADIVFIIDEKPHNQFTREGNDLVMYHEISYAQDWTRYTIHVTTLDGRDLTVPIRSADVKRGHEEVVLGEGMPFQKDPSKKGNLMIKLTMIH